MEVKREISEVLDERMMEYSAYVVLHRALPSVFDGLKPSYRRILYTMLINNMTKLTKSANVSGTVMKIHPHADSYPTIVGMVQEDNNINPLIIGKGSFAQHTSRDLQPASARYSEVRLSEFAIDMMKSLDKDIVDMIPTFDGAMVEPLNLPVRHPQILTIAQQGMAVGMASNIPSYNITEVCQATIDYVKNGTRVPLVPDFATKGFIVNDEVSFAQINATGKGSFKLRGRCEIEGRYILIKEIPYTTTREAIIEKIVELVKSGKLKEVAGITDTTGLEGMEIEILSKTGTDMNLLVEKLYQLTPLESSFSANMNVLVNNVPRVMGAWEIIREWVEWRRECIKRVLEFDANKLEAKLHILRGLEKCLLDIDNVVSIIRNSEDKDIQPMLMKTFDIDEIQSQEVMDMRLRNINKDYIIKKIKDNEKIAKTIISYRNMANDKERLDECIISGLTDVISKFGKPRHTQIIEIEKARVVTKEDLIEDYNCYVSLTKEFYIKKHLRPSDTQKMKDGDEVICQLQGTNKSDILIFTNLGNMYQIKAHELETVLPSTLGTYVPNLVTIESNEKPIACVFTNDYKGYMLFGFENGKMAKIDLTSYNATRKKLTGAYNMNSKLVYIEHLFEDKLLVTKSSINKILIVHTSLVGSKSTKSSQGNQVLKSKDDSTMVYVNTPSPNLGEDIINYYMGRPNAIGVYLKKEHEGLL